MVKELGCLNQLEPFTEFASLHGLWESGLTFSLVTVLLTLHLLELHHITSHLVLKKKAKVKLCLGSNGLP